jgi:hypothetical protein
MFYSIRFGEVLSWYDSLNMEPATFISFSTLVKIKFVVLLTVKS